MARQMRLYMIKRGRPALHGMQNIKRIMQASTQGLATNIVLPKGG